MGSLSTAMESASLRKINKWGPILLGALWIGMIWSTGTTVRAEDTEDAYVLNQEAMVDMSMAQFEAAAEKFLEAAAMVSDYQIKNQKLRYTPTFMAAWAHEKLGNFAEACLYFREFLEISPEDERELTKVKHATDYLNDRCR